MLQWTFASSLAVLITAGTLAGPSAAAQTAGGECTNRTLTGQDQRRLAAVVKAALPADAKVKGSPEACRNPGEASASFETEHSVNAEGIEEWFTLACERGQVEWRCDRPFLERRASFARTLDEQERRIHLAFTAEITLAAARDFAIRAFDIYQQRQAPPNLCKPGPAHEDPQETWNNLRVRYRLKPADVDLKVSVRPFVGNSTRVRFFTSAGPEFIFRDGSECWSEWTAGS